MFKKLGLELPSLDNAKEWTTKFNRIITNSPREDIAVCKDIKTAVELATLAELYSLGQLTTKDEYDIVNAQKVDIEDRCTDLCIKVDVLIKAVEDVLDTRFDENDTEQEKAFIMCRAALENIRKGYQR